MSQTWDIDTIVPASSSPSADIQKIIDAFNALLSGFSGATEPAGADLVAHMFWNDTANDLRKQRNAANSAWIVKGTLSAIYGGLLSLAGGNLTGGLNAAKTTVASATTPDIFAVTVGNTIDYTGTATATGFAAAPQAGCQRLLVCAAAAVFTAGANMLIDGITSGSNFTAAAGDKILVTAVTTTQFRLTPMKADGRAVVASAASNVVMDNGRFVVTMSANAVTIALKGLDGNDPSPTNAVNITFRSSTLTSSAVVTRSVTSALSTVISSGSTGGTLSGLPSRIYVGAIDNAGTVELCWWNPVSGPSLYAPSESALVSTTAEGGAGAADSAQVVYSTTARSSVALRVLGYFEATEATAGTWATAASVLQLMGPGVRRTGDLVGIARTQTGSVATGTTVIPNDDTIPQNTEGDQYMAQAITPLSAINLLRVSAGANFWNGINSYTIMALFQDSVANALAAVESEVTTAGGPWLYTIQFSLQAGTVSATTFKIRAGTASAGTITFNGDNTTRRFGGVNNSYLEIMEVWA